MLGRQNSQKAMHVRPYSAAPRRLNLDSEIDHLIQKTKAVDEDRKNFYRQSEEMKAEIQKLKAENLRLKALKEEVVKVKKSRTNLRTGMDVGTVTGGGWTPGDQMYLRRLLDKERHQTKLKKNALFTLQDKLKEVQDNKLGFVEECPLTRNIRLLENRLDKIMIKYNEAQSVQKAYEQIVTKLREERVGYDSQLATVEASLRGKEQEFQEMLLLAHHATHGKEAALQDLKKYQQRRAQIQQVRSKYLNDKKEDIGREVPDSNQALTKTDKAPTHSKMAMGFTTTYKHDENYQRHQLSEYEETFQRLKEVTGVIDANEIIQKFKTQGMTTKSLEELKESYRQKIEELKREKEQLKREIQNRKFTNDLQRPDRRRLDQIQSDMAVTTNQYERIRLKHQKLSKTLISIRAGIEHLKEITSFYKRDLSETLSGVLDDDLKALNEKLRRMYDVVKSDPNYMKHHFQANATAIKSFLNANVEFQDSDASSEENQGEEDKNQLLR